MNPFASGEGMVWAWRIASVSLGGGAGYAYYRFVGCKSGYCPITGNPWLSTIYGVLLGALLVFR